MLSLLKADFYRMLKSKITIVSLILSIIFPIFVALLYYIISKMPMEGSPEDIEAVSKMFTARSMIGSSFSFTNGIGIIIPIFGAIFVSSDLKNGTLRNKIVIGHDRKSIYLSHLITSIIYFLVIMLIYVSVMTLISCLLFGYGMDVDVKELAFVLIIGFASYIFAATISTLFNILIDSTSVAIILTVACCLGLSLLCAILAMIEGDKYQGILYFVPLFANTVMGTTLVTSKLFIEGIISLALFSAINVALGMYIFVKKDLK